MAIEFKFKPNSHDDTELGITRVLSDISSGIRLQFQNNHESNENGEING